MKCGLPHWSVLKDARRGFALVLTVSLLAFLVLLVVSLSTLTRLESVSVRRRQNLVQARQNALLALDVAVGQLQLTAGADTRVTADGEAFVPGNHYTGIWDTKSSAVDPLTWLVSGNEGENPERSDPDRRRLMRWN